MDFFKDLSQLKVLYLIGNKLTWLSDVNLHDLKNLSKLAIYGNPITKEQLERIKSSLPNTEIIF